MHVAGVVEHLADRDATADQFDDALDRLAGAPGPPAVTHLFNGMPSLHHREPGPVGTLLDDDRVTYPRSVRGSYTFFRGAKEKFGRGTVAGLLLATFVQMILGELFPKNYALARPEQTAGGQKCLRA